MGLLLGRVMRVESPISRPVWDVGGGESPVVSFLFFPSGHSAYLGDVSLRQISPGSFPLLPVPASRRPGVPASRPLDGGGAVPGLPAEGLRESGRGAEAAHAGLGHCDCAGLHRAIRGGAEGRRGGGAERGEIG